MEDGPMSPNSRQRKKYYSDKLADVVKELNLNETDENDVVINAMKKLNII